MPNVSEFTACGLVDCASHYCVVIWSEHVSVTAEGICFPGLLCSITTLKSKDLICNVAEARNLVQLWLWFSALLYTDFCYAFLYCLLTKTNPVMFLVTLKRSGFIHIIRVIIWLVCIVARFLNSYIRVSECVRRKTKHHVFVGGGVLVRMGVDYLYKFGNQALNLQIFWY